MEDSLRARIKDLDRVADTRDITKVSMFLSPAELSDVYAMERELTCPGRFVCGGFEDAERCRMFFPASYEEREGLVKRLAESHIACVKAEPVNAKFADALSHRDYLGALMNLGIERSCLGDIRMEGNIACIFVVKEMAEVVTGGLTQVKHTSVKTKEIPLSEGAGSVTLKEMKVNVASERLDGVIAAVFKLSRSEASALIASEKVFLDGRAASGNSAKLAEGMKISARGCGKFIYEGIENESRKGRLFVKIQLYV